ncbi:unnamed protein product [Ceutorhynchus assimilis]|uniref:Uncharacterized protein n=1 Tax=Ceutorhynchus assimilis TaxID=467358 RepID=A0A9N9MFB6_9CUCU|nr:unnamed protein product [Ceutorhynchus assimilis]
MKNQIFNIFCALFFAQALVIQARPNDLQANEVRGIPGEIYEGLLEIVKKGLEEAIANLNKTFVAVNQTIFDFEAKVSDDFNLALDPVNAKLNESIENAEEQGINITKCQSYIGYIADLPNDLNNEMLSCSIEKLYDTTDYTNEVLDNIHEFQKDIANLTSRIKDCEGSSWTETICLGLLTPELFKDIYTVPIEIDAEVEKAVNLMKKVIPQIGRCYSESLAQVPIIGMELVDKFTSCTGQAHIIST